MGRMNALYVSSSHHQDPSAKICKAIFFYLLLYFIIFCLLCILFMLHFKVVGSVISSLLAFDTCFGLLSTLQSMSVKMFIFRFGTFKTTKLFFCYKIFTIYFLL